MSEEFISNMCMALDQTSSQDNNLRMQAEQYLSQAQQDG